MDLGNAVYCEKNRYNNLWEGPLNVYFCERSSDNFIYSYLNRARGKKDFLNVFNQKKIPLF